MTPGKAGVESAEVGGEEVDEEALPNSGAAPAGKTAD